MAGSPSRAGLLPRGSCSRERSTVRSQASCPTLGINTDIRRLFRWTLPTGVTPDKLRLDLTSTSIQDISALLAAVTYGTIFIESADAELLSPFRL